MAKDTSPFWTWIRWYLDAISILHSGQIGENNQNNLSIFDYCIHKFKKMNSWWLWKYIYSIFFCAKAEWMWTKTFKRTKKFNYKVSYFKNANSNGGSPLYLCKCVFFIFYKVTKKTRSAAHRSIVKVCRYLPTLLNKTKKGERVTLEVSETHLENVAWITFLETRENSTFT